MKALWIVVIVSIAMWASGERASQNTLPPSMSVTWEIDEAGQGWLMLWTCPMFGWPPINQVGALIIDPRPIPPAPPEEEEVGALIIDP